MPFFDRLKCWLPYFEGLAKTPKGLGPTFSVFQHWGHGLADAQVKGKGKKRKGAVGLRAQLEKCPAPLPVPPRHALPFKREGYCASDYDVADSERERLEKLAGKLKQVPER